MSDRSPHPTREELSAYSLGQLPQERAVAIDSHISECQTCCETIVGISSDDTFVGLLKEARQLPTDQTFDHGVVPAASSGQDVPAELAEHLRYEILGLIGKGGMGDVYKATHRMMDRTVALKIIKRELVQKPEPVDRFHREVKAAAKLSHPNIVTAYDAEQAGDVHFLVMEYVDGTDLSQLVKDQGALPIHDACDYARQAAIGLQHAHEQGMVHRDIKPHNLMLTADGTVKILDFGLASLAPEANADSDSVEARGDLTAAGAIMGTPDFISPEQAEDARQADIRSDIYSLGSTLYFLLSGQPPFADGSIMHKLKSHATAEPDALRTLRDDVPVELETIVARMTAKNPDERFQSPSEVAAALEPFVQKQAQETAGPATDAQPPRRRGPFSRLTAFAAAFLALLLAAAVYFVVTNSGVVRIEVLDDSLNVAIDGRMVTVDEDGKRLLAFRAGDHEIVVRQGETELITDEFELRRNGDVRFRVSVEKGKVVVSRTGEEPKTAELPGARESASAVGELLRRESEGLLSRDQVNELIDLILEYQADRERPWSTEMGDLIEERWVAGELDRDLWEKYTAQFLVDTYQLEVRPRIVIGSPGGMRIQQMMRDVRCGSGKHITYQLQEKNRVTRIGSTIVGRNDMPGTFPLGHDSGGQFMSNSNNFGEQLWEIIKPGKQKITFEVELAILESVGPEGRVGKDVFATRKVTFETETTFLPAGQSTVNINVDPAMKAEVERAISIWRVETGPKPRPTTGDKYFAKVILAFKEPRPIDTAFTIVLKDGENEYGRGSVRYDGGRRISQPQQHGKHPGRSEWQADRRHPPAEPRCSREVRRCLRDLGQGGPPQGRTGARRRTYRRIGGARRRVRRG